MLDTRLSTLVSPTELNSNRGPAPSERSLIVMREGAEPKLSQKPVPTQSKNVSLYGKALRTFGSVETSTTQVRQDLARAVCQTNLIGEATDTPPSHILVSGLCRGTIYRTAKAKLWHRNYGIRLRPSWSGILACWLATVVHPLGNSVCLGLSAHGASSAGSSRPANCHGHYLIYSITHLTSLPANMQLSANLLHRLISLTKHCFFQSLPFLDLASTCKLY